MSDMVPEVLNAALDSLFTPKEPGEQEYQGVDGLLYCRNCHCLLYTSPSPRDS